MKSGSKPTSRRNGRLKVKRLLISAMTIVVNASAILASGIYQWHEDGESFPIQEHRRLSLQDSKCTLYRKFTTYEPGVTVDDESWACKLSTQESDNLDGDFFDIDESSSLVSAHLATAISGESTLSLSQAFADTDSMQLVVPNSTHVDVRQSSKILLDGDRIPPSTFGIHRLLVIRVTDGNNLTSSVSADQLYENLFGDKICLKTQMKACSYGKLQIEPFMGITPSQIMVENGIVDINVTGIAGHEAKFAGKARKAANEILGNLDDPRFGLVMFCLPKGPKAMAWAYAKSKYSFFTNKWCGAVAPSMHEVGHNLGLGHSGEKRMGANADGVGFMGSSTGKGDVQMCYNPQKSFQLGWYDDKTKTINPVDGKGLRIFKLNGIADYRRKNNALVALRLEQVKNKKDFYIGYNLAKGINKDTREDKGKVTIVRKDTGGPREFGQSTKIATLLPGQRYVIRNFNNVRNVQIIFKGIRKGNAKIVVVDSDEPLSVLSPTTTADEKCKEFTIELKTDRKPKEISWYITDKFGNAVAFSKKYRKMKRKYKQKICLPMRTKPHNYKFTMLDDGGNGLCCRQGSGWYKAVDDQGQTIFSGSKFLNSKRHVIKVPKNPTSSPKTVPSMTPTELPSSSSNPTSSSPPSTNPTEFCIDNPTFHLNDKKQKNCKWVAEKRTSSRCEKQGVMDNCRATCDPLCTIRSTSPSHVPSFGPTSSVEPSAFPNYMPIIEPNRFPSEDPSFFPSHIPSSKPTLVDSVHPSSSPSILHSFGPTLNQLNERTSSPSYVPSESPVPSVVPSSGEPSEIPSLDESKYLPHEPTTVPSPTPSRVPTSAVPSGGINLSSIPSMSPSDETISLSPTISSQKPSLAPSGFPSGTNDFIGVELTSRKRDYHSNEGESDDSGSIQFVRR